MVRRSVVRGREVVVMGGVYLVVRCVVRGRKVVVVGTTGRTVCVCLLDSSVRCGGR